MGQINVKVLWGLTVIFKIQVLKLEVLILKNLNNNKPIVFSIFRKIGSNLGLLRVIRYMHLNHTEN